MDKEESQPERSGILTSDYQISMRPDTEHPYSQESVIRITVATEKLESALRRAQEMYPTYRIILITLPD